jgi:glycerol-3-phosphate dehydrogenase (NAD(P)+)
MMEMNMIAEGYYATKSAFLINEKNNKKTRLPIIKAVYDILYLNKDPKKVFEKLTDKLD